jgi:hypothetical protein
MWQESVHVSIDFFNFASTQGEEDLVLATMADGFVQKSSLLGDGRESKYLDSFNTK